MPNAKRLKNSAAAKAKAPVHHEEPTGERPTPAEVEEEEHQFVRVARAHWLKTTKKKIKVKVKNDVLKQSIWEVLERDGFQHKSLLLLESLQTLESYLWPGYTEEASNVHVLLMALIINVKRREHLETWTLFEQQPEEFSSFFRRVLSLSLDRTLTTTIRTNLLCFLIHAFQTLDSGIVRRECAPLVSIGIWHNISTDQERDRLLNQTTQLRKSWRAAQKRFDAGDDAIKARLRFERSWLYTLLLDFLSLLYEENRKSGKLPLLFLPKRHANMPYRARSILRTIYRNDLNLLPAIRLSPMYNDEANGLFRDLQALLTHFTYFSIDDQTGAQLTREEAYERHCKALGKLQRTALKYFKEKLTVLALSNYGSIDRREELSTLLQTLTDDEVASLAGYLGIRTKYPEDLKLPAGRQLQIECMLSTFERKKTFQELAQTMSIVPTEKTLFDASFQRADSYDGSHPLALPKLNLQYLSAGDFLWRALILYRCESFYGIRRDIETAIRRLQPESKKPGETHFAGVSKMALPISKPAIIDVVPALIGELKPSMVKAEVSFDVRKLGDHVRKEWDSLRPDDVVFLLSVEPPADDAITNGFSPSELERIGVSSVRAAEVIRVTDDKGRHGKEPRSCDGKRRIELKLDSQTYAKDAALAAAGKRDVYGSVNLLLRRGRRENNFKPVLETIRDLVLSDAPLPSWLHEVFLGYGDPAGASYKNLPNRIKTFDYNDTFLEWQHLIESLPGKTLEPSDDVSGSFGPPYVLETLDKPEVQVPVKASKKRRRDAEPETAAEIEALKVTTYKPPNQGPYPVDAPKFNSVRFTPAQVEAIMSGSQPGLTVVVGPPGTEDAPDCAQQPGVESALRQDYRTRYR
ncbi:Intron-binding protein aquarius [Beauveria bassiana D1-5]|uniref:Intron-binding protein aquarius n=1 Tax=Beauveria bassiana D1-5 TaxID=1245745 RepID=A0A0A2V9J8_BEABA|nr:Intron-binding protein aquarius [Beauveria bassiana D1-5]